MSRDHEHSAPPAQDDPSHTRAPSHAERGRTLAAAARTATLSSLSRDPAGYPYGSLVTVAADAEGRPVLLLSDLAEHTGNLAARAEASILITEPLDAHKEALATARVTLMGACRRVDAGELAAARDVFLAAHPSSASYVELRDFAFYRLTPVAIRFIGGFGRMSWVDAGDYRRAEPDPLATAAPGILAHMNKDHKDALLAYARVLSRIEGATDAVMTAVDRYGFEMRVTAPEGPRPARLSFDSPLATTDEVRKAMISLVRAARSDAQPQPTGTGEH